MASDDISPDAILGLPVTRDVTDHLPLTESTFFILLSLAPGPQHGYAMLKDVETLSGGRLRLSTGTLYGALQRLLDQGWIAPVESAEAAETGRPRKAYTLTALGQRVTAAETARLKDLAATAQRRLARTRP
jgi:DNA-binding PadR family transcriptional regulator